MFTTLKKLRNREMLFCDINPTCYQISLLKEILLRHMSDLCHGDKFAKRIEKQALPNIVSSHSSNMIKRGEGVNLESQQNKQVNIILACDKINGIVIRPNEVFSFWRTVGIAARKKGYQAGRVLIRDKLTTGVGGGLCNLANTIHLLVLHSPLEVTEFHHHSDALAPDEGGRVPFSAGTSVSYNNVDYRFRNNSDQDVQLLVWCEGEILYAELRSETAFPYSYRIVEEDHHFGKVGNEFYRISQIYKETFDPVTDTIIERELILDNKSPVMFDYSLIPKDQIRE